MVSLYERLLQDPESLGTRTAGGCLVWNYACISRAAYNNFKGYASVNVHSRDARVPRVMWNHFVDANFPIWYDKITKLVIDHNVDFCGDTRCYELKHLRVVTFRKNITVGKVSELSETKYSSYTGVSWHRGKKKWQVSIYYDSRAHYLGMYDNEEKAASAYRVARLWLGRKRPK